MTRDDLDLLRDADPVRRTDPYPDAEVTRNVAAILAADGAPATAGPDVRARREPRWLLPALAAAVVLVLALVSAVVFTGHDRSEQSSGPGGSPVTCAISTAGGSTATRGRERLAEQVITTRVSQLGARAEKFTPDAADGTIGFTPHGISAAAAAQACRATTTAIRPLVTSPVPADTGAARSSDPLAALAFPVPRSEAAHDRLSTAQRARLAAAMSHFNCAAGTTSPDEGLMCEQLGGKPYVYLLAPALVAGSGIETAAARAPDAKLGTAEWTVDLHFRAAAAARMAAFTRLHNSSRRGANVSVCGAAGSPRCADFLAFTVDNAVVSVPYTTASVSKGVQVSGSFTRQSAQALAAEYTAASIGLHRS